MFSIQTSLICTRWQSLHVFHLIPPISGFICFLFICSHFCFRKVGSNPLRYNGHMQDRNPKMDVTAPHLAVSDKTMIVLSCQFILIYIYIYIYSYTTQVKVFYLDKLYSHHNLKLLQGQYSWTLIYILCLRTFELRTVFFFGTYYFEYVLHLTYSNLIYVLSRGCILNTEVRISKYKAP